MRQVGTFFRGFWHFRGIFRGFLGVFRLVASFGFGTKTCDQSDFKGVFREGCVFRKKVMPRGFLGGF